MARFDEFFVEFLKVSHVLLPLPRISVLALILSFEIGRWPGITKTKQFVLG